MIYQAIFHLELRFSIGEREDMQHVYNCKTLNKDKSETENYNKIYEGNISQQISVYTRFEENLKQTEKLMKNNENNDEKTKGKQIQKKRKKSNLPCDLIVDPLYCKRFSNKYIYIRLSLF